MYWLKRGMVTRDSSQCICYILSWQIHNFKVISLLLVSICTSLWFVSLMLKFAVFFSASSHFSFFETGKKIQSAIHPTSFLLSFNILLSVIITVIQRRGTDNDEEEKIRTKEFEWTFECFHSVTSTCDWLACSNETYTDLREHLEVVKKCKKSSAINFSISKKKIFRRVVRYQFSPTKTINTFSNKNISSDESDTHSRRSTDFFLSFD